MKKIFVFLLFISLFLSCQSDNQVEKQKLQQDIGLMEAELLKTGDASKQKDLALKLVEKSVQFVKAYPQDSLSPTLLFKAGDVARGAGEFGKAIEIWGNMWRNYGQHPDAPKALFLQGFTFDGQLGDAAKAKEYYHTFLETYPNSPLSEQVKQLLSIVDKDPNEMVKEFEKNRVE